MRKAYHTSTNTILAEILAEILFLITTSILRQNQQQRIKARTPTLAACALTTKIIIMIKASARAARTTRRCSSQSSQALCCPFRKPLRLLIGF